MRGTIMAQPIRSLGGVLSLLLRLFPYSNCYFMFNGGDKEHIERLFRSFHLQFKKNGITLNGNPSELIPELFSLPSVYSNINQIHWNRAHEDHSQSTAPTMLLPDVELPPWAGNSAPNFVFVHRIALESPYVKESIEHWFDLIFGSAQQGDRAFKQCNVFRPDSYQITQLASDSIPGIASDSMVDRVRFGVIPRQIKDLPLKISISKINTALDTEYGYDPLDLQLDKNILELLQTCTDFRNHNTSTGPSPYLYRHTYAMNIRMNRDMQILHYFKLFHPDLKPQGSFLSSDINGFLRKNRKLCPVIFNSKYCHFINNSGTSIEYLLIHSTSVCAYTVELATPTDSSALSELPPRSKQSFRIDMHSNLYGTIQTANFNPFTKELYLGMFSGVLIRCNHHLVDPIRNFLYGHTHPVELIELCPEHHLIATVSLSNQAQITQYYSTTSTFCTSDIHSYVHTDEVILWNSATQTCIWRLSADIIMASHVELYSKQHMLCKYIRIRQVEINKAIPIIYTLLENAFN